MHEWAELFKQLWKKSRNEFDTKTSGIVNVIMRNSKFKCKLEFKSAFSKYNLKFLLTHGTAKLYRLGIYIESNLSIKPALEFIKKNPWPTADQFYSVIIHYHPEFHKQYQEFLDEYISQGYYLGAVSYYNEKAIRKNIRYREYLSHYNNLSNERIWNQWNELSIQFCSDPLENIKGFLFNKLEAYSSDTFLHKIATVINIIDTHGPTIETLQIIFLLDCIVFY